MALEECIDMLQYLNPQRDVTVTKVARHIKITSSWRNGDYLPTLLDTVDQNDDTYVFFLMDVMSYERKRRKEK